LQQDPILQEVVVRGEISNFTHHASGHLYFSLKDADSTLSCVCFRNAALRLRFKPENGAQIVAWGSIAVYEKRGQYQLMVTHAQPDGEGGLAAAFEQLKARLEAEGLFAPERKRPLPAFPRAVGLITSPTGAAVADLVSVLTRRYPLCRVVIIPTLVQGAAAVESIRSSLALANRQTDLDLLIVARGGGSLEDLWCFNDEQVARAVFGSRLPVISAVGHETDTTICDLVADLRAPTPSAAAELAVPEVRELQRRLGEAARELAGGLQEHISQRRQRLMQMVAQPLWRRPQLLFEQQLQRLDEAAQTLREGWHETLRGKTVAWERCQLTLAALSPLAVLERGYAIVRKADDEAIVRHRGDIKPGEQLRVTLHDGEVGVVAE
jgi:exodeoxyribonuclease VII large subunit